MFLNSCTARIAAFFCFSICLCFFSVKPVYGLDAKQIELLQDRQYVPELIKLIGSAQHSIKVCMFQAIFYPGRKKSPSNQILDALVQAHSRGVRVLVILDNGGSLEHVRKTNTQTARFLKKAGIAVYFDSETVTTHTKFLTIDDAIAVFGSTNWTYSALAKNHELSAVVYSQEVAKRINVYFETVLKGGKRF